MNRSSSARMSSAITITMLGRRDWGTAGAPAGAMSAGSAVFLPAGRATGDRPSGPLDPSTATRVTTSTTASSADKSTATRSRPLPDRGRRGIGSFPGDECAAFAADRPPGYEVRGRDPWPSGRLGCRPGGGRLRGPLRGVVAGQLVRLLEELLARPPVQPVTEHGSVAVVGLVLQA